MKFDLLRLDSALGCILAHGVKHSDGMFKKGRVLSWTDIEALQACGVDRVFAARLETDDVPEDIAAQKVAITSCGTGTKAQQPFTGRANIHSSEHGLVVVDHVRINELNRLHESLTIATLSNFSVAKPKQMVATVKIIPFALNRDVLDKALAVIGSEPLVKVCAFEHKRAGLIVTELPQTKASITAKSETAIRDRLAALHSTLAQVIVCKHEQTAVCDAIKALHSSGCEPILVFGASAIVDRADVIPMGLVSAGGTVEHLGMPVDPGNLLMLGQIIKTAVIGVPSCARSPKTNGFDWVLERIVAGLGVSAGDIMEMGAGGLLAEIESRPSPREPRSKPPTAPRVAAIVLAAGKSSRMGSNKMLADFHGEPLLRVTVQKIMRSSVDDVVVVTGNEHENVKDVLSGLTVTSVYNPHFADGLSTSLRKGLQSVADQADAVIICLGDMPLIEPILLDRLIAAFSPTENRNIVVPVYDRQLGNPVLWGKEYFVQLMALEGDHGARSLIESFRLDAVEIDAESDAVLRDADTPDGLERLRGMI